MAILFYIRFIPTLLLSKGGFTIYVNIDASRHNNITGIELKSILMNSGAIILAEQRV